MQSKLILNKNGLKKIHKLLIAHKTITTEHLKENIKINYDVICRNLGEDE